MSSIAPFPDPLVTRLEAIQKLIDKGKLPDAADRLNAAAKNFPGDPRVFLLGARLAEAAGNAKGAQDAARRAVNLSPNWPVAVMELSFLLARQNQLREAVGFAEKGVALDGNNPEVLARAIDVAHRAQNFDLAIAWLQRAMAVSPDNIDIKRLLARDFRLKGRHEKAMALYDSMLLAAPEDPLALKGRIETALAMGDRQRALADCDALLLLVPGNEEVLFHRQVALGETPPRLPEAMVRSLYDGYAELYDQHVVASLKYKLPREVARVITDRYPDKKLNVLDLGCGTGLLGVCLGRIDGALVGVDLSAPMIAQAARHNVYDRFHHVDLLDALRATPESLYDVIAALDVFIYAGDMAAAIPDALRILRPGGHFIFSCEETAADEAADLVLRPTMRYAHRRSHVELLCKAAGFADLAIEAVDLRFENLEPVAGFMVIARKS